MAEDPTSEDPNEPPRPDDAAETASDEELPPPPTSDALDDIRFVVEGGDTAPLVVTVSGGTVERGYGPADLIGKVAERVAALIDDLSGGARTMLYGVAPGRSMTFLFGDPKPESTQTRIPVAVTHSAARRVAELMDLDGEDLFARAVELGLPARRYDELAELVQTEGITLEWKPRAEKTRELDPRRAGRHHVQLHVEPEFLTHDLVLNGVLYRVIAHPGTTAGTIGIQLFNWSTPAPGPRPKAPVIAYDGEDLYAAIRGGLIGEPVEATIRVKQPRPGTAIDARHVDLELVSIDPGPGEASALGMSIDDILGDEP